MSELKAVAKVIQYTGNESLQEISQLILNISCGTSLQCHFILNQDDSLFFYHRCTYAYEADKFIRSYVVQIGQYIVQYAKSKPFVFNTIEEVHNFIAPQEFKEKTCQN